MLAVHGRLSPNHSAPVTAAPPFRSTWVGEGHWAGSEGQPSFEPQGSSSPPGEQLRGEAGKEKAEEKEDD